MNADRAPSAFGNGLNNLRELLSLNHGLNLSHTELTSAMLGPCWRGGCVVFTKRNIVLSLLFTAMLTLGACTTPHVRHDYDSRANIANYHTYAWEQSGDVAPAGGPAFNNPLNYQRLRAAVNANLTKQGLRSAAEGAAPDCFVTVAIGSRQTLESDDRYPMRVGVGWGWWHPGWMGSMNWATDGIYTYREGRIAVDMFDAKTREPLWHAEVEKDLSGLTGEKAEAHINAVVAAMFTKFPGAASPAK